MIGKLPSKTEKASDPFAFTDAFKTGIQSVDDQHQRLFDIIRETNDLIHEELLHDKYDEIVRLLDELREYTKFHFEDEEAYMQKINSPMLEAQKRAHQAFVDKLMSIDLDKLEEIDDNQQEYLHELIEFLGGWLINHILKMDTQIEKTEQ